MKEIWKPLNGINENYFVSSMGRIKTIDRIIEPDSIHRKGQFVKGRIISTKTNVNKYESFMVGKNKRFYVHRMVAQYFIGNGEIPEGHEVNHKNGNTKDNRVENLEIITHQQNMNHANYILNRWEKQKQVQNKKVRCVEINKVFSSMKEASEYFGDYRNKGGGIGYAIKTGCSALGHHWEYV